MPPASEPTEGLGAEAALGDPDSIRFSPEQEAESEDGQAEAEAEAEKDGGGSSPREVLSRIPLRRESRRISGPRRNAALLKHVQGTQKWRMHFLPSRPFRNMFDLLLLGGLLFYSLSLGLLLAGMLHQHFLQVDHPEATSSANCNPNPNPDPHTSTSRVCWRWAMWWTSSSL